MHQWSSLEWQGRLPFSQNSANIIADAATKDEIQAKNMKKKELAETDSVHDSEKLAERIAKLSGGMAVIKAGAATERSLKTETEELRMPRMLLLLLQRKELFLEVVLPKFTSPCIPAIKEKIEDADERLGADESVEGEVVVKKIKDSKWEVGYNAMIDRSKNLLEAGVIDLAKVTCALLNAASVAGMVLTT